MDIVLSVGWLLIGLGAYCAIQARRLDDELRRSLPPSIELRRAEHVLRGLPKSPRGGLLAELERALQASEARILDHALPDRWRPGHNPARTQLVYRMWRLTGAAFALIAIGLSLVSTGAGLLP